nr:MAG TPA: hypothetical protein [Caudoviricetes sp.]
MLYLLYLYMYNILKIAKMQLILQKVNKNFIYAKKVLTLYLYVRIIIAVSYMRK